MSGILIREVLHAMVLGYEDAQRCIRACCWKRLAASGVSPRRQKGDESAVMEVSDGYLQFVLNNYNMS
jgi:hypothetical protein